MAVLVSSPKELEKLISREEAPELYEYLEMGGFLRLNTSNKLQLKYPTKEIIQERIKELKEKRKDIIYQLSKLRRMRSRGRILDPLKIKHVIMRAFDRGYREIADKIELEKLFDDERGRKIIEQLQKSQEYREKIRLALEESPVYRNRKFGDFVERTQEMRGKLLDERLRKFESLLKDVDRELDVLRRLLRWM